MDSSPSHQQQPYGYYEEYNNHSFSSNNNNDITEHSNKINNDSRYNMFIHHHNNNNEHHHHQHSGSPYPHHNNHHHSGILYYSSNPNNEHQGYHHPIYRGYDNNTYYTTTAATALFNNQQQDEDVFDYNVDQFFTPSSSHHAAHHHTFSHFHPTTMNTTTSPTTLNSLQLFRPMIRIHVYPNGTLQYGKCLTFDPFQTSFEELLLMISRKFKYNMILPTTTANNNNRNNEIIEEQQQQPMVLTAGNNINRTNSGNNLNNLLANSSSGNTNNNNTSSSSPLPQQQQQPIRFINSARSERESDGLLPKLFTLRGTEVDHINQIVNNDIFCFVLPTEPFRPPISLERVILNNLDSSQSKPYFYSSNYYGSGNNDVGVGTTTASNNGNAQTMVATGSCSSSLNNNFNSELFEEESNNTMSSKNMMGRRSNNNSRENLDNITNTNNIQVDQQQIHETVYSTPKKNGKVGPTSLEISNNNNTSASATVRSPPIQLSVHRQFHTMPPTVPVNLNMAMVDPFSPTTTLHFASPNHLNFTTSNIPPQSTVRIIKKEKHFIRLIPELYFLIFSFLSHKDLCLGVGLVCKEWDREYARNDIIWKELCMNVYCYYVKRKFYKSGTDKITKFFATCSLNELKKKFNEACEKPPCYYKSWKTYYRYFINWSLRITWDTCERGNNIKFKNNNATIYRDDNITYHWQTIRTNIPIRIPTEQEKRKNGYMSLPVTSPFETSDEEPDIITDDVSIYEFEIKIEKFDRSNANGWWIVIGLETEMFPYKESTPTNLIGYDRHGGFGYGGNGDSLHFYSNTHLKHKQAFTCDPVIPWSNVTSSFNEGDIIKCRVKHYTKAFEDAIDPKNNIGATLSWFLNGKYLGQCFRNITGTLFPAVSLLTNQCVTLRNVDPMLKLLMKDFE
ncbi:hypothetical protein ABK040_000243 [Willaertia magna]